MRAAAWIEGLGRADDHAELVAHHYDAALELGLAAGGVRRCRSTARAACIPPRRRPRAAAQCVPGRRTLLREALAIWPDDAERPHVLFAHARARSTRTATLRSCSTRDDALEAAGEVEAAAEAAVLAAHAAWRAGRTAEAEALLARGASAARGPAALAARSPRSLAESARLATFGGRLAEAEETSLRALELAEAARARRPRASARTTLGVVSYIDGDLRQGRDRCSTRWSSMGRRARPEQVRALTNLAVLYDSDGCPRGGPLRIARRAMSRQRGWATGRMLLWIESARFRRGLYPDGRWDEALARGTRFSTTIAALGGHYAEPGVRSCARQILAARGRGRRSVNRTLTPRSRRCRPTADPQTQLPTFSGRACPPDARESTSQARSSSTRFAR